MPTTVEGKEALAAHEKPATPETVETTEAPQKTEETAKKEETVNWEERYKNLEKIHGKHTQEVKKTREEIRMLQEKLNQPAAAEAGAMTPDKQLLEVQRRVREGELSWEDGLVQASELSAQIGASQAQKWFQQELGNRDAKANANRFLEKHPDFLELQDSGVLDEVMNKESGIIQDQIAAYYAYKAQMGEEVGYNRAKEELNKLSESEQKTKTVLKKPGSAIRQTNTKPLKSQYDIKTSMLDALSRLKEE